MNYTFGLNPALSPRRLPGKQNAVFYLYPWTGLVPGLLFSFFIINLIDTISQQKTKTESHFYEVSRDE